MSITDVIERTAEIKGNAYAQAARNRGQIIGNTLQSLGQIVPDVIKARSQEREQAALAADREAQAQQRGLQTQILQRQLNTPPDPTKGQKDALDLKLAQHEAASRLLLGANATNWAARRPGIVGVLGPESASELPEQYPGDDTIKAFIDSGVPVKDQLEAQRKALEDAEKKLPKPLEPFTLGPGQQRFSPTGEPLTSVPANPPAPAAGFNLSPGQTRFGPDGKPIASLPPAKAAGETTVKPVLDAQGNPITGDDLLKTLPPGQAVIVKKLAEGKMAFPSGMALKSEYWQKLLEQVGQYDPTFDAVNYPARAATRRDFTSGKSADSIRALNTVVGHIAQLSDAADALKNGNVQSANSILNSIKTEFGWTGKTDFDTIAPKVAQELTRVWRGTGGSEADIQRDIENLSSSNAPAQLHSSIGHLGGLIESQLSSMQEKYRQGMGIDDIQMITPQARKALSKLQTRAGGGKISSGGVTVTAPNGKTYSFPDQSGADAFKKSAGIP